jgi:HEAT repeat protein
MADRRNKRFYQIIRAAFIERGEPGRDFLLDQLVHEQRPDMRRDVVQLLGSVGTVHVLPAARELLLSNDPNDRYCGSIVIGWIGQEKDFDKLVKIMTDDPNPEVRGYAVSALRQMWLRHAVIKDRTIAALIAALRGEIHPDAVAKIIVSLQTVTARHFGIKENVKEQTLTGDPKSAKERALRQFYPDGTTGSKGK